MTITWSGCWEERPGRTICRWMLVWDEANGSLAGCIAGYSGGGTFQCEKFVGVPGNLTLDCDDDLTVVGAVELIDLSEDCLDVVLKLHDSELWLDSDNLILKNITDLENVVIAEDLIYSGKKVVPAWSQPLFERLALTAQPKFFV